MTKLFKCEKCLREFSRKQHLIQHYNRKIPCVNSTNEVIYNKNIPRNILPHATASGNIFVTKTLRTEQIQDDAPNMADPISEPGTEPALQSEPKEEINSQPAAVQPNMAPSFSSHAREYHNKTIKSRSKLRSAAAMKAMNEYDE